MDSKINKGNDQIYLSSSFMVVYLWYIRQRDRAHFDGVGHETIKMALAEAHICMR